MERMAQAAVSNRETPKIGIHIASGILGHFLGVPPGEADESFTQLVQMGRDAVPVAMEEYMDAAIRQHGKSPAVILENLKINQAIDAAQSPLTDGERGQ